MNEPEREKSPRTKGSLLSLRIVLAISTHSCGRPIISEGQIPSIPTLVIRFHATTERTFL